MVWGIVSFVVALILSLVGVAIVGGAFDIYAKVVFWTVVCVFLAIQFFHFTHVVRDNKGG